MACPSWVGYITSIAEPPEGHPFQQNARAAYAAIILMFCWNRLCSGMRWCLLSGYQDHEHSQQGDFMCSKVDFIRSLQSRYLI
jgi:hypothetical protein